jgi:UDP-N-acetylglucosamine acyltransferase
MSVKIHATAIINPNAEIDENVEIGPYAVIGEEVKIKSGTYIGPHSILEFAEICKDNHFTGHAFIGTPPQDYKYHGEKTKIIIGDNNIIREGVSLHRGSPLTSITTIGNGCMFMANSHIGHDCRVGNKVIMVNSSAASGHVTIEDNVTVSAFSGLHQFTQIGTLAMLGGGSMVSQDIIPYVLAQGDRAKPVGLNIVGLKRAGISRESIKSIKYVFKTLFLEGHLFADALKKLKTETLLPEAKHMVEFCEKSKRGISRPKSKIKKSEGGND